MKTLLMFLSMIVSCANSSLAADRAVVSKRTIYPGQLIDAQDLKIVLLTKQPRVVYRFATNETQIAGLEAAKTILAGRFIPLNAARPPALVNAGSHIWVQLKQGALSIRILCVALVGGGVGDRIKLRNESSGKMFLGLIQPNGTVVASTI